MIKCSVLKAPRPDGEGIVFPAAVSPYRPFTPVRWSKDRFDPRFAPYGRGELLFINTAHPDDPNLKLVRVQAARAVYHTAHRHLVPKYRVQTATRAGVWSVAIRYVSPEQISRAYFKADGAPRDLPRRIRGLDDLAQVVCHWTSYHRSAIWD